MKFVCKSLISEVATLLIYLTSRILNSSVPILYVIFNFFFFKLKPSRCVFTNYSKSQFSQNTTNLLSIKVATCFDSRSRHQASYWTMFEEHQVKVYIWDPKCLQQCENVNTIENWSAHLGSQNVYNNVRTWIKLRIESAHLGSQNVYNNVRTWVQLRIESARLGFQNVYNNVRTWVQFSIVPTFSHCCKHFGNPHVHFHLMYLKHGSINSLMMTPRVETSPF